MPVYRRSALIVGALICWSVETTFDAAAQGLAQGTVEKALEQARQTGMPVLAVAGRKT